MMKELLKFLKGESGTTAIEYGLIAFFIAVAIVVGVNAVGNQVLNLYNQIQAAL